MLPSAVNEWLEGPIVSWLSWSRWTMHQLTSQDSHAQHQVESYSQTHLISLTVSFLGFSKHV